MLYFSIHILTLEQERSVYIYIEWFLELLIFRQVLCCFGWVLVPLELTVFDSD
ncbi:hypothetical protein BT96DRAFT_566813 [Gymnopus androsaceus JB14]|uniref:Uncharacterized protein n=1 Tax=Gymnopus androsaceus JB14 TaxID=1447944 RepID=A0A6A4HSJ6_9AGAR|nr:hypothetical protein BT96DRAFT_566813 [Gymnopus androsaceus JB14]